MENTTLLFVYLEYISDILLQDMDVLEGLMGRIRSELTDIIGGLDIIHDLDDFWISNGHTTSVCVFFWHVCVRCDDRDPLDQREREREM